MMVGIWVDDLEEVEKRNMFKRNEANTNMWYLFHL